MAAVSSMKLLNKYYFCERCNCCIPASSLILVVTACCGLGSPYSTMYAYMFLKCTKWKIFPTLFCSSKCMGWGGSSCVASVICEGDTNLETKFENLTGLVTGYEWFKRMCSYVLL